MLIRNAEIDRRDSSHLDVLASVSRASTSGVLGAQAAGSRWIPSLSPRKNLFRMDRRKLGERNVIMPKNYA